MGEEEGEEAVVMEAVEELLAVVEGEEELLCLLVVQEEVIYHTYMYIRIHGHER